MTEFIFMVDKVQFIARDPFSSDGPTKTTASKAEYASCSTREQSRHLPFYATSFTKGETLAHQLLTPGDNQ